MTSPTSNLFRRACQNLTAYWKKIGSDYKTVAIKTYRRCTKETYKAGFYFSGLAGLIYAYHTNPTQEFMLNELREWRQIMSLVPLLIHNKQADEELAERSVLLCQNRLQYYNFWFFSLLVRSTYDASIRTYESQDLNLKNGYGIVITTSLTLDSLESGTSSTKT